MDSQDPIGVFDSGIGGLTVLRELLRLLPGEDIIYLGDTARVPYGNKSAQTVVRYSLNNAGFLLGRRVKMIVVACNTASAYAIDALQAATDIPIIGVVDPGARAAVQKTRTKTVGVLGTRGTVKSRAYERAMHSMDPQVHAMGWPCPLFVPLAEEGIVEGEIAYAVAKEYLSSLARREPNIDCLVLGCTHYPLLTDLLAKVAATTFEKPTTLIDSASAVAGEVQLSLEELDLTCPRSEGGSVEYYVTDLTRIEEIGQRFLGRPITDVEQVDIG